MEHLLVYQSPFAKKRIGRSNDGGYVIVELPDSYDMFISGGISDDISFEEHLLELHLELECYAFDGTISELPKNNDSSNTDGNNRNRIHFIKKNLGDSNTDTLTDLQEYMTDYRDIFLKMDIEGHEFQIMPKIIEKGSMTKIKQLVIEIHSPGDMLLFPDYFTGLNGIDNQVMFDLLQQINQTHTLVHFHANNGCNIQTIDGISLPHVFELTYIRNDFITEKIRNVESLPTNLDMKNVEENADYYLSGFPYSDTN